MKKYWRKLNILNGVWFAGKSWEEVSKAAASQAWRKLWLEKVADFVAFTQEDIVWTTVSTAWPLFREGLSSITADDLYDLVGAANQPLDADDVLEIMQEDKLADLPDNEADEDH